MKQEHKKTFKGPPSGMGSYICDAVYRNECNCICTGYVI